MPRLRPFLPLLAAVLGVALLGNTVVTASASPLRANETVADVAAPEMSSASTSPAADDVSVPVWSIATGDVVATRDTLIIDPITLTIGLPGPTPIKFLFELQGCCEDGTERARFLAGQADPACVTIGAAPSTTVECTYTRDVVLGQDEQFVFHLGITRPARTGSPSVYITTFLWGGSAFRGRTATRVSPVSDFVVTVDNPPPGRVGEIVDFEWTLTNVGLDPVYWRNGMITVTAPPGTEFVSPDPIGGGELQCFGWLATPTLRQCWFDVTGPGPEAAHKQVWRLRIVSPTVGQGQISAQMANYQGKSPELDYVDPTPQNNVVPITVRLRRLPPIRF